MGAPFFRPERQGSVLAPAVVITCTSRSPRPIFGPGEAHKPMAPLSKIYTFHARASPEIHKSYSVAAPRGQPLCVLRRPAGYSYGGGIVDPCAASPFLGSLASGENGVAPPLGEIRVSSIALLTSRINRRDRISRCRNLRPKGGASTEVPEHTSGAGPQSLSGRKRRLAVQ